MKKYRVNVNGTDYEITLEALKDGEDFAPKAEKAPVVGADQSEKLKALEHALAVHVLILHIDRVPLGNRKLAVIFLRPRIEFTQHLIVLLIKFLL